MTNTLIFSGSYLKILLRMDRYTVIQEYEINNKDLSRLASVLSTGKLMFNLLVSMEIDVINDGKKEDLIVSDISFLESILCSNRRACCSYIRKNHKILSISHEYTEIQLKELILLDNKIRTKNFIKKSIIDEMITKESSPNDSCLVLSDFKFNILAQNFLQLILSDKPIKTIDYKLKYNNEQYIKNIDYHVPKTVPTCLRDLILTYLVDNDQNYHNENDTIYSNVLHAFDYNPDCIYINTTIIVSNNIREFAKHLRYKDYNNFSVKYIHTNTSFLSITNDYQKMNDYDIIIFTEKCFNRFYGNGKYFNQPDNVTYKFKRVICYDDCSSIDIPNSSFVWFIQWSEDYVKVENITSILSIFYDCLLYQTRVQSTSYKVFDPIKGTYKDNFLKPKYISNKHIFCDEHIIKTTNMEFNSN